MLQRLVKMKKKYLLFAFIGIIILSSYFVVSEVVDIINGDKITEIERDFGVNVYVMGETLDKFGNFRTIEYRYGDTKWTTTFQESELNNASLMNEWKARHNGMGMIEWYGYKGARNIKSEPIDLSNDNLFREKSDEWRDYIEPNDSPVPAYNDSLDLSNSNLLSGRQRLEAPQL